jgi:hypothetical protein
MSDDTVEVPAGHEVRVFDLPFQPGVTRTPAGLILAGFGSAGDDADRELDMVLAGVDRECAEPTRTLELVAVDGRMRIADTFAPSRPKTLRVESPITWCFHAGAITSLMATATRRNALFERMHRLARSEVMQSVSVIGGPSAAVVAFADVLRGLRVPLRVPDASQGGQSVQIEVKRPDGETLCIFAGHEYPDELAPLRYAVGELCGMDDAAFSEQLASISSSEPVISYRSPRLGQLMIDGSSNTTVSDVIVREVVTRELPVFAMRDASTSALGLRTMSGQTVIPVYADVTAMQWAAVDLGKPDGSVVPGALEPSTLIRMAAKSSHGIAVGLYRDRKTPMYAVLHATLVAALMASMSRGDSA